MCGWIEQHCVYGEGDYFGEPVRLQRWQKQIIYWLYEYNPVTGERRFREALIEVPKGQGKALALDTLLPTPSGWTTMADVRPGDVLFDEHGQQTRVLEVHPTMVGNDCFRVTFSDGSSIVADAEHLWVTQELRHEYRASVKTTREIAGSVVTRADGARNHRIPVAGALELPDAELSLDPYVLGAWLGDGDSDTNRLTCGWSDIDAMIAALAESGQMTLVRPSAMRAPRLLLPGARPLLRKLGLLGNKHIPATYLRASIKQRLDLLRGLLDTDGSITEAGQVDFSVCSERLARGTCELVTSLGIKSVLRPYDAKLNGRVVGRRWRLHFNAPVGEQLFRLERKQRRVPTRCAPTQMSRNRMIVAVEPVASVPVRCIRVDSPSSLFLAGESMVPTHNTPLNGWVQLFELLGPPLFGRKGSPIIPVAAASFEQADLLFGDMKHCCRESPTLRHFVDVYDTEILVRGGPGRAYRVAAMAGTNDGQRPSGLAADEIHEWLGNKERVHLVLVNGLSKRANSIVVNTTTPGSDLETLAGRKHLYGYRVNAGELDDPRFMFVHYGAPDVYDLTDPDQLRAAVLRANPAAGTFLRTDDVIARFYQIPEYEYRRYHLGQWTRADECWLPPGAWEACAGEVVIDPNRVCVVGVDMALKHDSVAVCVAQRDRSGRVAVQVRVWDPAGDTIDVAAVENHLRELHRTLRVETIAYDPAYFVRSAEVLLDEGLPMAEFSQGASTMVPACQESYRMICDGMLVHPDDPVLTDHVLAAAVRETDNGWRLSKGRSKRKIDACIAMVMAIFLAGEPEEYPAPPPMVALNDKAYRTETGDLMSVGF